jgi:hypothetical protein
MHRGQVIGVIGLDLISKTAITEFLTYPFGR